MSFIATRMSSIDASGIRKVFELAATMKEPINLSIGQPDYDVDEVVKEAAIQKISFGNPQTFLSQSPRFVLNA